MIVLLIVIWLILVILVTIFIIYNYIKIKRNKSFSNVLIIKKPTYFKKTKQLDLSTYINDINEFQGNNTQFTLFTWLFINPINKNDLYKKQNKFPLSNILCKGNINNPLPLILYNHYTNCIYIYMSIGNKNSNIISQINNMGANFWKDLESNPRKYPGIYIIKNTLVGRWFQFGLVINSNILEIYINGLLRNTFILKYKLINDSSQNFITLGKLGSDSVLIDSLLGQLTGLRYFSYILPMKDIHNLYSQGINSSYSNTREVKDDEFSKDNKKILDVTKINIKNKDKQKKKQKKMKSYDNSAHGLKNNEDLLNLICNKKTYTPNPKPLDKSCNSNCDCYGLNTCNTISKTCTEDMPYINLKNKNCCLRYAKDNDATGDLTKIVNSWDNIPYGCVSSKIDSSNKDERYVWYNTNKNSTASLEPHQQIVSECSK